MTQEEKKIFEEITAMPKWYAGIHGRNRHLDAAAANRIKNRFNAGTLSDKMLERIFNKFGYFKKTEIWNKI